MHPRAFARELAKRFAPEGVIRDWERVARTEIGEARNRGAYEAERRARGWTSETLIYRNLSATPCSGCLKLYKQPDGMPRRYPVAFVEAEDAKGYNRGHWREWHVRIGLTHPQCRDSPWSAWHPVLASVFAQTAAEWKATYARRGIEEATA